MSLSLRIWVGSVALAVLLMASLCLAAFEVLGQNTRPSLLTLALFAFIWLVSIPNVLRLRKMIADHKRGLK